MVGNANPALDGAAGDALRLDLIGDVVGYILAAVLVLFALGPYGLFFGPVQVLEQSNVAGRRLRIRSVDDLKEKLGRVVMLLLAVRAAQLAREMKYAAPSDLLYLALGILLITGGLYLTGHCERVAVRGHALP